jgi:hypothetical protein
MGISGQRHARPRFSPGERTPCTHCTGGWVGPRAGLDTEAKGKILSPLPGIEPRSPGRPARSQTLYWLIYRAHKYGRIPSCTNQFSAGCEWYFPQISGLGGSMKGPSMKSSVAYLKFIGSWCWKLFLICERKMYSDLWLPMDSVFWFFKMSFELLLVLLRFLSEISYLDTFVFVRDQIWLTIRIVLKKGLNNSFNCVAIKIWTFCSVVQQLVRY